MILEVTRKWFTAQTTCGILSIDGVFQCYTLEPRSATYSAGQKPYFIPEGSYKVSLQTSPHFGVVTPHILDVPGFSNIEIHWGNFARDTEGCTVVGEARAEDIVLRSRLAFAALMQKISGQKDLQITYQKDLQITYQKAKP